MYRPIRTQILFLALALLVLPKRAAAGEATGRFERTLTVSGAVDLDVETGAGRITVRTGDINSVRVAGLVTVKSTFWRGSGSPEEKVRAIESKPPIEQFGSTIRIGRIRDEGLRRDLFIDYEIVVPADTTLRADTGLGDIVAGGIRRTVKANTGAGTIRLTDIAGDVTAETGLGDVEIRGAKGSVRANTGAGKIRVEGEALSSWRLNTGLGDVYVAINGSRGFDVRAHTGLGSVHSKLPLTIDGSIVASDVRGKVRGGGPLVDINTGAGSISIE